MILSRHRSPKDILCEASFPNMDLLRQGINLIDERISELPGQAHGKLSIFSQIAARKAP